MTCATLAAWLLVGAAFAGEEGRGYGEARTAAFSGFPGDRWQTVERVRPTFATALTDRLTLVATMEAALTQGRNAPPPPRRAADYLDVDRLYLDQYGERVDVRVGRQALHWGSAQYFNPTDPFPEVLLAEPWRPRRGVNAIRTHAGLGALSDVTGVVTLDDRLVHPRVAARTRTNIAGTDLAAIGAWRGGHDWLAGLDLRGTFGVGWWIEAALQGNGGAAAQAVAGADYSFPVLEKIVTMVQYQRDDTAATGPSRASRDSVLGGLTVQATQDFALSAFALVSLHGGAGTAIPGASWAATDWLEVAGSGQVAFGVTSASVVTIWMRASF